MRWVRPRLNAGITILLWRRVARATMACNCFIKRSYGSSSAIAVRALRDQNIDVLNGCGVGQEMRVAAAQIAGEDQPSRPAVFAKVELDDRGAQYMPGVQVGQRDARGDFVRLLIRRRV